MTNSVALRAHIRESGLKYQYIAKKLGITAYGLKKKIDNITEFKASEVVLLCDILDIRSLPERERIFFASV